MEASQGLMADTYDKR